MQRPNVGNFRPQSQPAPKETDASTWTPEHGFRKVPQSPPNAPSSSPRTTRSAAFADLPTRQPGSTSGNKPYMSAQKPYSPTPGASAGLSDIAVKMQVSDWLKRVPNEQYAASKKASDRINACQSGKTDCLELSDLKLNSLPPCLSAIKAKVLILDGNSLETLPSLPPGLLSLSATGNNLTSLPALPAGLKLLDMRNNKLTHIPDLTSFNLHDTSSGKFEADLRGNPFSNRDLRAAHNHLKSKESGSTKRANVQFDTPPSITPSLEMWVEKASQGERAARLEGAKRLVEAYENDAAHLDLSGLCLTELPDTLSKLNVKELQLQNNNLISLPDLPPHLESLYVGGNGLATPPQLPATLINLNLENNCFAQLPALPPGLQTLHASNNRLQHLNELPAALRGLNVSGNDLTSLPPLPEKLVGLDVRGNRLTQIPTLPDAAWSKSGNTHFMADLRDNQFSDADLRKFHARIDETFNTGARIGLQLHIDRPQEILVSPCPVEIIKSRKDAAAAIQYLRDQGVPHENLVALRADLDAYMLHNKLTGDAFDARYQASGTVKPEDGKFFDSNSSIQNSDLRKNFVYLRTTLPTS